MAKKKRLYSLTPEHREQLKPTADWWIANAMSTKAMDDDDKDAMRIAIRGLYEAAGLQPPPPERIIFVPSPFVLRYAGGFAAAIWDMRARGETYTPPPPDLVPPKDPDLSKWYVAPSVHDCAEAAGLGDLGIEAARRSWEMWQGGNQWSSWAAYVAFFRHVAKLPIDYSKWDHWEQAAIHGGPRIMHPKFCMVSDRPELLLVDDANRPHCDDGPFCRWRDGTALFAIHGVRVPAWVVLHPERITLERITSEANAEVRRVMIERYGLGRFMADAGGTIVNQDECGKLWRMKNPIDSGLPDLVIAEVVNGSPEPDGSYRTYHLDVTMAATGTAEYPGPDGRPVKINWPIDTCRAAVAATYGISPEEYANVVRT